MAIGQQPLSAALRFAVAALVEKRSDDDQIIVHHFTDTRNGLQLEVEHRSPTLGISFERIKIIGPGRT